MYEQMWNRWVVEMGLHNINESATTPAMGLRKANFNFLMTWNDGGGGGAYIEHGLQWLRLLHVQLRQLPV